MAHSSPLRPRFWHKRLIELFGLVVLSLAGFVAVSVLSYTHADATILAQGMQYPLPAVANLGGIAGAAFGEVLVPVFGHAVLLIALGLAIAGYQLLSRHTVRVAPFLVSMYATRVLAASALIGWLTLTHDVDLAPMGGSMGTIVAGQLILALGTAGSVLLLAGVFIATLLAIAPWQMPQGIQWLQQQGRHYFEVIASRYQSLLAWWQGRHQKVESPRLLNGPRDIETNKHIPSSPLIFRTHPQNEGSV